VWFLFGQNICREKNRQFLYPLLAQKT
jgi:hypothetical protein